MDIKPIKIALLSMSFRFNMLNHISSTSDKIVYKGEGLFEFHDVDMTSLVTTHVMEPREAKLMKEMFLESSGFKEVAILDLNDCGEDALAGLYVNNTVSSAIHLTSLYKKIGLPTTNDLITYGCGCIFLKDTYEDNVRKTLLDILDKYNWVYFHDINDERIAQDIEEFREVAEVYNISSLEIEDMIVKHFMKNKE